MKYFKYWEFDSPDDPGSGQLMDEGTLEKLDKARELAQIPFNISSGFRTIEHNRNVGGVPNSAHTHGNAADIIYQSEADAARMIWALSKAGFQRIGKGKSFIHVDDDGSKPQPAFWQYDQENEHKA